MTKEILIVGAGGHAKVVIATIRAVGWGIAGVFDDNQDLWGSRFAGCEVLGPLAEASAHGREAVLAVGANRSRQELAGQVSLDWVVVVHPTATVDPSVDLGPGTVVTAGATIQPDVVVGAHVIVNTSATIDHDCRIESFAHVAPRVALAGDVSLGQGVLMGIGSCASPGVRIGDWAVVGAGAAVVGDLEAHVTAVGVPARPVGGADAS